MGKARLERLNANLLVLDPSAGVVRLQQNASGVEIFQLMIFDYVLAVDAHQAILALHHQLHQIPLLRFYFRINRSLISIERTCGIDGALHIMNLNLIMPAQLASGRFAAEQDAAVREAAAAEVKLQMEIPITLDRAEMAQAVAAQDGAERLPGGLALHRLPLLDIVGVIVQALPLFFRRQFPDA